MTPKDALSEETKSVLASFGGDAVHGGDVWSAARRLKKPVGDILDLSASLNPLGPPPGLTESVRQAMDMVCHYPDRLALELRLALARDLGVEPANVLPGNGSVALIRILARAMDLSDITVVAPVFGEFARSLAVHGRHFHYLVLSEKNHFSLTANDLERLWEHDPSCVILTNPITPSGDLVRPEVLDSLLNQAARRRAWLIIDEAFMDFAPARARAWAPAQIDKHPRLVVLRSLTKFYCIAGLRLGFAMAHHRTLAELAPLGEPWSVNTLAQAAGRHCLAQSDYAKQTRESVDQWRESQARLLAGLGWHVFPSQTNYLLCRLPSEGPTAAQVAAACAAQGVLVRDASSFVGCHERHLRLAVTTPDNQDYLLGILGQAAGV